MILNSLSRRQVFPWKTVVRAGLFLIKASLFLPFPLFSQTCTVATASIPFSFSAGVQTMPAGQSRLSQVNEPFYTLAQADGSALQHMVVSQSNAYQVP
jgi:hypothetical protein